MPGDHPLIYIPLGNCEICRNLGEVETSFSKYGWEEMDYAMPEAANRLTPAENITECEQRKQHYKTCPICGIFYQYDYSYEYLVNGSEDTVTLMRLTPDDIRFFISDETYAFLLNNFKQSLFDSDGKTREYAARCLAAHYLARDNLIEVEKLLDPANREIMDGTLFQILQWTQKLSNYDELLPLVPSLQKAAKIPASAEKNIALYLLTYVLKMGSD
jgi:hypothetical protein